MTQPHSDRGPGLRLPGAPGMRVGLMLVGIRYLSDQSTRRDWNARPAIQSAVDDSPSDCDFAAVVGFACRLDGMAALRCHFEGSFDFAVDSSHFSVLTRTGRWLCFDCLHPVGTVSWLPRALVLTNFLYVRVRIGLHGTDCASVRPRVSC